MCPRAPLLPRSFDDASVVGAMARCVGMPLAAFERGDAQCRAVDSRRADHDMREQPLAVRVDRLEQQMELLTGLPERIDRLESQVLQLRHEMRVEFHEMRAELSASRSDSETGFAAVRAEAAAESAWVRSEFAAVRAELRAGDEETRAQMRVLHEELISRLTLIQEGQSARRTRREPTGRKRSR